MSYSIGQVSERLGIPASTIRFYDKEGLLPFLERTEGGVRVFSDHDISWLNLIECLKMTNMPLKDIKQFIDWFQEGDSTLEERRQMFYERKACVEEQMAILQRVLDTVNYKCWFYDTSVEAGTSDVHRKMKPDDIPENIQLLKAKTIA